VRKKLPKEKKATKQLFGKYPQKGNLLCAKKKGQTKGEKETKIRTKTKTYSTSKNKQ
jgi:hypothetical protein